MDYYDDPDFSYPAFWKGREYEHRAELFALQKLLRDNRFTTTADIGGGFGRLAVFLSRRSQHLVLVEPAAFQRTLAASFVSDQVVIKEGSSDQTGIQTKSCDLVVMVRVMHHLPMPEHTISELWRILKPNGLLILEFANASNFKSRARNLFRRLPQSPVDKSTTDDDVPFVNHHPVAVQKLLRDEGFVILEKLSVSNFRSPFLKKITPLKVLLVLEQAIQKPLGFINFGPSIFILARRPTTLRTAGLLRAGKGEFVNQHPLV